MADDSSGHKKSASAKTVAISLHIAHQIIDILREGHILRHNTAFQNADADL